MECRTHFWPRGTQIAEWKLDEGEGGNRAARCALDSKKSQRDHNFTLGTLETGQREVGDGPDGWSRKYTFLEYVSNRLLARAIHAASALSVIIEHSAGPEGRKSQRGIPDEKIPKALAWSKQFNSSVQGGICRCTAPICQSFHLSPPGNSKAID